MKVGNYYSAYVSMYADLLGPLHKMLQVGKYHGRKGSKQKLVWTTEANEAFHKLQERLFGQLGLFLVHSDEGLVLRTYALNYALGALLEQVRCDGTHVRVAIWSRVLAEGQRWTWTAREKETYAPMPSCAPSRNDRATSDYNPWWDLRIINHREPVTGGMLIPLRVRLQAAPNGTRRL